MESKTIKIILERREIDIDRKIYESLFENSFAYDYKDYKDSLVTYKIKFKSFVEMARKADIPYTLFFASPEFVKDAIDTKDGILLSGASKTSFSMNSRGRVRLQDIELIVKDLMRKQELLKSRDKTISENKIYHLLYKSRKSIEEQAEIIRGTLKIDLNVIKVLNKTKTFEYIILLLEDQNVFISQSSHTFMPQIIRPNVKFSGLCIKDKKIPFIFLNNKEETASFEPESRKTLTLILLMVCMAKGRFMPISYDDQTKTLITNQEFIIAEEILMPAKEIVKVNVTNLDDIKDLAQIYSVTPSAFLMRLRRLNVITKDAADKYFEELQKEFESITKQPRGRRPDDAKGYKKYNSTGYSKALVGLVNAGKVPHKEAVKILFQNKKPDRFFYDYQANL